MRECISGVFLTPGLIWHWERIQTVRVILPLRLIRVWSGTQKYVCFANSTSCSAADIREMVLLEQTKVYRGWYTFNFRPSALNSTEAKLELALGSSSSSWLLNRLVWVKFPFLFHNSNFKKHRSVGIFGETAINVMLSSKYLWSVIQTSTPLRCYNNKFHSESESELWGNLLHLPERPASSCPFHICRPRKACWLCWRTAVRRDKQTGFPPKNTIGRSKYGALLLLFSSIIHRASPRWPSVS